MGHGPPWESKAIILLSPDNKSVNYQQLLQAESRKPQKGQVHPKEKVENLPTELSKGGMFLPAPSFSPLLLYIMIPPTCSALHFNPAHFQFN